MNRILKKFLAGKSPDNLKLKFPQRTVSAAGFTSEHPISVSVYFFQRGDCKFFPANPCYFSIYLFVIFFSLLIAYVGWTLPGSSLRMRGLRTAAVTGHKGPAVPTSASLCLQKSHACLVSAYFWTPRLSLGHPGSFGSAHDLKWMRTQTRPRFNVPSERRGTTTWVV